MKAQIYISGQIGGNSILNNAIGGTGYIETKKGMFNSIYILFDTKTNAKKALRAAYKRLRLDEPEFKGAIRITDTTLYYDASSAQISTL